MSASQFDFPFTLENFKQAFPLCKNPEQWYNAFVEVLPQYDITSIHRVVAFLSQCAHESSNFNVIQENLNYSAEGLVKTFPTHFNEQTAHQYAKQPQLIANRIYANRMGNGDEQSGDGYKYRGRGIVQITGKENYSKASQSLFDDPNELINNPDYLLDPDNAVHSACWFWESRGLNSLADDQQMKEITRRINGGYIGLPERIAVYNKCIEVFDA